MFTITKCVSNLWCSTGIIEFLIAGMRMVEILWENYWTSKSPVCAFESSTQNTIKISIFSLFDFWQHVIFLKKILAPLFSSLHILPGFFLLPSPFSSVFLLRSSCWKNYSLRRRKLGGLNARRWDSLLSAVVCASKHSEDSWRELVYLLPNKYVYLAQLKTSNAAPWFTKWIEDVKWQSSFWSLLLSQT